MIKLITGKKGTGKTKIIIERINNAVKTASGNVVCIEKGETLRREISYKVRWVGIEEFAIADYNSMYGFIAGMLAGNYDIQEIFIDGILKICGRDYDALGNMFVKLSNLTKDDTRITFTVSAEISELPDSVKQFLD